MSSGPKNVTSTTSTEVPEFLRGPLQNATQHSGGELQALFNQGQGGASGKTAEGTQALFDRGQQGSPLINDAKNLTGQTIRGDFLSPDSNPFLEGTFNRAADLTRGRLDSEFSGAGRNLGAAAPARSDELQTLASNIYGGNFQAERDRQQQAVGQSQPLAQDDFRNIQAMIDAGSFPVDQFIDRLSALIPGAGGTTTSTQPVFKTGLF